MLRLHHEACLSPDSAALPNGVVKTQHAASLLISARERGFLLAFGGISCQPWAALAGFKDLANLALALTGHLEEVLGEFDSFFFRTCVQDGEAGDHLFCFREGSVGDGDFTLRLPDPSA